MGRNAKIQATPTLSPVRGILSIEETLPKQQSKTHPWGKLPLR